MVGLGLLVRRLMLLQCITRYRTCQQRTATLRRWDSSVAGALGKPGRRGGLTSLHPVTVCLVMTRSLLPGGCPCCGIARWLCIR